MMKATDIFGSFTPLQALWAFVLRLAGFFLIWWVLAEGVLREPVFVITSILTATAVSHVLWPPGSWRWHPLEGLRFIPWFLWNSLLGGLDVAFRAFHPKLPLQPEIVEFKTSVAEKPTLLFAWMVSLLPGTACIMIGRNGRLRIHVLDASQPVERKMRALASRLAKLCR